MKVIVKGGLLYRHRFTRENMIDCPEADMIAHANGFWCAEQVAKLFDGETIEVDDDDRKIKEMNGQSYCDFEKEKTT